LMRVIIVFEVLPLEEFKKELYVDHIIKKVVRRKKNIMNESMFLSLTISSFAP
jgi:type II secretory pathway predicted ATPase ExeA